MPRPSLFDARELGQPGTLQHRCGHCKVSGDELLRCTGCNAARYCCRGHQIADRPKHKSICNRVKKARIILSKEEDLVRNATPTWMTPANAFETSVGHFWAIVTTRDYMLARHYLANLLRNTLTLDGTQEALDHSLDMLWLCRSDNLGLRDMVPALMLQLDKDQESYDFVKWWFNVAQDTRYDWDGLSMPYLDVRNADVLEGVKFLDDKHWNISHVTTILLIVIKLLIDMRNIDNVGRVTTGRLPLELAAKIQLTVIRSPLAVRYQKMYEENEAGFHREILRVESQIKQLGTSIHHKNEHFFRMVLDHDPNKTDLPEAYTHGSPQEAQLMVHNAYIAWYQTEGVIPTMNRALAMSEAKDNMCAMWSNFGRALRV